MAPRVPHTTRRAVAAGALTLTAGIAVGGPAAADPPGNNGTIKVDAVAFDNHPDNEPHVGCAFEIDFYGYDEGDLDADVLFELHPPTGSGVLMNDTVFIGEDPHDGGGSVDGLDAHVEYDLTDAIAQSGVEPHDQQGWHVKVTIDAEGSQGADVKHKVFWVTGCEPEEPTTTPTTAPPTTTTAPPTTAPPTTTVAQVSPPLVVVGATPVVETPAPVQVLSESLTAEPATEVLGVTQERVLARTGSETGLLALVGALLSAGGFGSLRLATRMRRR